MRSLVYYVATSLDGYIADLNGDFSAFPQDPETLSALFSHYPETCPTHLRQALSVVAFPRRFDTVLMGYSTYAPAEQAGLAQGAYAHLRQLVATHRQLPTPVETVAGDLSAQIATLKQQAGRDIWLCGGGALAGQLVDQIDELQLKVNPVTPGTGVPLFRGTSSTPWSLVESEKLPGSVLLNTYRPKGIRR